MLLQNPSQHDMLDASMFWVGLLMALTPLVIIGGVVGFVLWQRRAARRRPAAGSEGPPGGPAGN